MRETFLDRCYQMGYTHFKAKAKCNPYMVNRHPNFSLAACQAAYRRGYSDAERDVVICMGMRKPLDERTLLQASA